MLADIFFEFFQPIHLHIVLQLIAGDPDPVWAGDPPELPDIGSSRDGLEQLLQFFFGAGEQKAVRLMEAKLQVMGGIRILRQIETGMAVQVIIQFRNAGPDQEGHFVDPFFVDQYHIACLMVFLVFGVEIDPQLTAELKAAKPQQNLQMLPHIPGRGKYLGFGFGQILLSE